MAVRNFFMFSVLPERTPKCGESQNTGISGHFGLGRPLALREKSWGWAENIKIQFPGARGTFGVKIRTPQKILPVRKVRNFFTFYVLADRTSTGGKSQNTGFLGHFGLGRPLALREIPGGEQKNTNSLIETEKR